jgi:hypothetical protein
MIHDDLYAKCAIPFRAATIKMRVVMGESYKEKNSQTAHLFTHAVLYSTADKLAHLSHG